MGNPDRTFKRINYYGFLVCCGIFPKERKENHNGTNDPLFIDDKLNRRGEVKKKQWNRKVSLIPIVNCAIEMVVKRFVRKTEGTGNQSNNQNHRTTALVISNRIFSNVEEILGDLL